MTISTYTDYLSRLKKTIALHSYKAMVNPTGFYTSSWTRSANAGAAPSTAAACSNTTIGAINLESTVGNGTSQFVISGVSGITSSGANVLICDRLSHSGGLDATVTSPQTTNLPTAALTRYTSGVGVMIGLEIYVALGTTATTATVSYTNQDGTAGRTTKPIVIGSTLANAASLILLCPLQDGDTGVRSVESVTLAASTVSAAGNFGVTLFKPLYASHLMVVEAPNYGNNIQNSMIGGGMQFEPLVAGACVMYILNATAANNIVVSPIFMDIS